MERKEKRGEGQGKKYRGTRGLCVRGMVRRMSYIRLFRELHRPQESSSEAVWILVCKTKGTENLGRIN